VSTTEVDQQAAQPVEGGVDLPERPDRTALAGSGSEGTVRWGTSRRWPGMVAPGVVYLAVRAVGLFILAWMTSNAHLSMRSVLTSWDGQWYLGIARGGYGGVPAGLTDSFGRRTPDTPLAFFPGYPTLVRWVGYLPGVDLVAAGFTVSLVCGLVAAYGLARLGGRVGGRPEAGLVLVGLFAAAPMAVALSMTYSEALFCALAVWSLVGLLERKWLLAGACALGTGLVRPTAAALVVTVVMAAIVAIVRRRDGLRPWLGLVLAPVGLLAYLGFVAVRTGSPTGWFTLQQQGWNSAFDGGVATVRFGAEVLASGRTVYEVVTVAVLLAAAVLVVVGIRRMPWPLWLYGVLVLAMDAGANGLMNSKARLLLPAFTLLLPPAIGLARRRPGTAVAVVAGAALASGWFGAYALTDWLYAI
jgi:hypothetical protein